MRNRIEQFANACAQYLAYYEGADFEATKQNAIDNADDLWNYLYWIKTEESRNICKEYIDVL